jgi:hypothetical protein
VQAGRMYGCTGVITILPLAAPVKLKTLTVPKTIIDISIKFIFCDFDMVFKIQNY